MYCPKCGQTIKDEMKFCWKCGTDIEKAREDATASNPPPSSPELGFSQDQSSSLACPSCHRVDSIRSVPSVYQESILSGKVGDEYHKTQTQLGKNLAPPENPDMFGFLVIIALRIIFFPITLLGYGTIWLGQKFGFYKDIDDKGLKEEISTARSHRSKYAAAIQRWNESFYCYRCHKVFHPQTQNVSEPGQFADFWWS